MHWRRQPRRRDSGAVPQKRAAPARLFCTWRDGQVSQAHVFSKMASPDRKGRRGEPLAGAFDEMQGTGDGVREPYRGVHHWLQAQKIDDLKLKRQEAEALFRRTGITFAVHGDEAATERLIPFDIIP